MEQQSAPEAPPTPAPSKGKGMWIGLIVVVIVIVVLLGAVFGGLLAPPATTVPQAVYHVGYPGDAIKYLPTVWTNRAQWTAKWFFSEGLRDQGFVDQLKAAGVNVSQIVGTAPTTSQDPAILASETIFNQNYTTRFGDRTVGLFASQAYDGIFVMALAFAKANTTDTSSAAWKQAMRDVSNPPGTVIRPTEWTKAKAELAAGRDIDYVGASGAVNFDQFGEVGSDYEVWGVNSTGKIFQKQFIAEGSWLPAPRPAPAVGTRSDIGPHPMALPVKIGTILSMTGSLGLYGPDILNATILAQEEINNQGGIWGGQLTMVHDDDATNPTTGSTVASKQINTDQVNAILGSLASSVSQKIYEVAKPAGIAELSPASTSPIFTTLDTVDLFWRTAPSDALQGKAAALYAYRDAGWRKVSVFNINNAYGNGLGGVFASDFTSRGGQVLRSVSYEPDKTSYDSELGTLFTPVVARAPPARVSRPEDGVP